MPIFVIGGTLIYVSDDTVIVDVIIISQIVDFCVAACVII